MDVVVKTNSGQLKSDKTRLINSSDLNISIKPKASKSSYAIHEHEGAITVKQAIKNIMVQKKEGVGEYLEVGSSSHFSNSYDLYFIDGKLHAFATDDIESFNDLQAKRSEGGNVSYEEQLKNNGKINITHVGTSAVLIVNLTLKDGTKKKLLLCPTRNKKDGMCATAISGYVNHNESKNTSLDPIAFTIGNEVHQELLLFDKENNGVKINFGDNDTEVFSSSYIKQIDAQKANLSDLPWLKTMEVEFHFKDGSSAIHTCFYDTRTGNLQVIEAFQVDIDLREIDIMGSETFFNSIDKKLYEKFYGGQGEESKLVFISLDGKKVYKPDSNSPTGLIEIHDLKILAECFNTQIDENGISSTNGDISYEIFVQKLNEKSLKVVSKNNHLSQAS